MRVMVLKNGKDGTVHHGEIESDGLISASDCGLVRPHTEGKRTNKLVTCGRCITINAKKVADKAVKKSTPTKYVAAPRKPGVGVARRGMGGSTRTRSAGYKAHVDKMKASYAGLTAALDKAAIKWEYELTDVAVLVSIQLPNMPTDHMRLWVCSPEQNTQLAGKPANKWSITYNPYETAASVTELGSTPKAKVGTPAHMRMVISEIRKYIKANGAEQYTGVNTGAPVVVGGKKSIPAKSNTRGKKYPQYDELMAALKKEAIDAKVCVLPGAYTACVDIETHSEDFEIRVYSPEDAVPFGGGPLWVVDFGDFNNQHTTSFEYNPNTVYVNVLAVIIGNLKDAYSLSSKVSYNNA